MQLWRDRDRTPDRRPVWRLCPFNGPPVQVERAARTFPSPQTACGSLLTAADDRVEQMRRLARPSGEGRAVDVDALRRHHLCLAVKREMMIELVHDDMGERRKARLAACNGLCRGGCLDDLVTGAAAILGPHGADDAPLDRGNIELLIAVVSQRTQRAARPQPAGCGPMSSMIAAPVPPRRRLSGISSPRIGAAAIPNSSSPALPGSCRPTAMPVTTSSTAPAASPRLPAERISGARYSTSMPPSRRRSPPNC